MCYGVLLLVVVTFVEFGLLLVVTIACYVVVFLVIIIVWFILSSRHPTLAVGFRQMT